MPSDTIKCVVMEDSNFSLLARIPYGNGYAQQADVTSITWKAFEVDDPNTEYATNTLSVASTIFDTLQTNDIRWPIDNIGYNFLGDFAYNTFDPGKYFIEITIVWTAGGQNILRPVYEVRVKNARGS